MTESVDTKPSILQPYYNHAQLMEKRAAQPKPAVSLVKLRPRRTTETALVMPPLRSLWVSLRDLIGGPR